MGARSPLLVLTISLTARQVTDTNTAGERTARHSPPHIA